MSALDVVATLHHETHMATSKRPRRKTAKRPPKKKPGKRGALIRFTATQKVTARPKRPHADGTDGGVWLLIMPITWLKSNKKGLSKKTKKAALQALKKFKKG